jgi:hypothetical protein
MRHHRIAGFVAAQGIGEIVKIADLHVVEANQDVAGLQPGNARGRIGVNVGETNAGRRLGEIGNAAEIRAVSASTAAARWSNGAGMRVGFFLDADEIPALSFSSSSFCTMPATS